MRLYVFAVYLPFFIFLIKRHEVSTTPISLIGWHSGGMRYLILYIVLTLPYCLYQILFFNKHFTGNNKIITVMSIISCVQITAGAFIPLGENDSIVLLAHTVVSVSGAAILMLTILFAFVLHAVKQKNKVMLLFLYGIYAAALLTAFYILYTAALFQLLASMSFFLVLLFHNSRAVITGE